MNRKLFVLVLFFLPFAGLMAQGVQLADCPAVNIGNPTVKAKHAELENYLKTRLQPVNAAQQSNGALVLTIQVDENGAPCLRSYNVQGQFNIEPNHIKNIVNEMPAWTPAQDNGQNIASLVTVEVRLKLKSITVKQL